MHDTHHDNAVTEQEKITILKSDYAGKKHQRILEKVESILGIVQNSWENAITAYQEYLYQD